MEKLLDYFTPNNYALEFNIDKHQKLLTGTASITGTVLRPTIKLHAKNLDISSLTINDQPTDFTTDDDVISIQTPSTGELNIKITYTHQLTTNMQGAYLSTYEHDGQTQTIVATQFESHYARECFPCIDEPAAKATFDLTITTDPADTVLSNMPIKTQENGTTIFETSPKMSTYLVAFVIGQFKKHETVSAHGIKVTTYASLAQPNNQLEYSADFAAKTLDFYDELFKTPYPLPKLDQVALPDFEAGAMENWGLITYREQALLCNDNSALDQKLYVSLVIAHEVSHQWFGNLVTMAWWNDLWLNESFATLIETYAVDKIAPQLDAWSDFYSGTVVPALRRDCLPGVQPVKCEVQNPAEIATLFDGAIVYAKGARLMLMLMRLMGESSFFAGLADYFNKYAYQNTTADDLWDSLATHANFDVREFMTPWLIQPGYPVLRHEHQQRFLIAEDPTESSFVYPIHEVKDDLSGHYIINLGTDEFQAALQAFDSKSTEQKLRLLFDRQLLAGTPSVVSADLLSLLVNFPPTTQYVIWEALASIVTDLKIFFTPHSTPDNHFKAFVGDLAKAQFARLGLTPNQNEPYNDTKLRPIILALLAYSEDNAFQASVIEQFGSLAIEDVNPNIRASILATLTRLNTTQPINDQLSPQCLIELYQNSSNPELQLDLLFALASIKDPSLIQSHLALIKDGSIRPGDRIVFFVRLLRNPTATPITLDWLYSNWDWLLEAEGDKTIIDYPRCAGNTIRTTTDFGKFKTFFTPKLNHPFLTRTLEIAFAEIAARLDRIATDSPGVIGALPNSS